MDLLERADHEIELIEQDKTLTDKEKRQAIKEVEEELRDILRNKDNCC